MFSQIKCDKVKGGDGAGNLKVGCEKRGWSYQRQGAKVAPVSKPAVSLTSKSAARGGVVAATDLEIRDTADLSVFTSFRRDRAEAGGEGGKVCAASRRHPFFASLRLKIISVSDSVAGAAFVVVR